jgi:DNA-binding protein HU-beta
MNSFNVRITQHSETFHFLSYYHTQNKLTNMNKAELIEQISKDTNLSKSQANDALQSLTNTVVATLKKGDTVTLVGFGTFSVSSRAARVGRNPQTGAALKIKARKVPKFKAGKDFKDRIEAAKAKKK